MILILKQHLLFYGYTYRVKMTYVFFGIYFAVLYEKKFNEKKKLNLLNI